MLKLENEMDPYQFEIFTKKGFFTIRRTDKFWCGIWSDMCIEQVLMRSMKTQSGLTHGRGMSENVISPFILTMIVLVEVCNVMEDFCNITSCTSDQHVDLRQSRICRDNLDV